MNKSVNLTWILFISLLLVGCHRQTQINNNLKQVRTQSNETFYTKVNIWYEKRESILSTNYHKGFIIPLGTKVQILSVSGEKIIFAIDGQNFSYTLIHVRKFNNCSLSELFDSYFGKENILAPGSKFYQFSETEQENIRKGTIALGMSKDAVIMAYGYPPSHKTPSLTLDNWTYWYNRAMQYYVTFKDNVVIDFKK